MLILSRRPGQEIVFPRLEVKVRLVRVDGNTARLAVEAPRHVEVFRAEILPELQDLPIGERTAVHELCNRMSKVTLSLHLLAKLLEVGQVKQAESVIGQALTALEGLDRDWVRRHIEPARPTATRHCRALVVDDDPNERELLAGLLSMNGCECQTAGDGDEAMERLTAQQGQPDFVLLDMAMPRRDGKQTISAIRADSRYRGIKVISISPTSPEELGITRGPEGVDEWFPKPLNPGRLWAMMQQMAKP